MDRRALQIAGRSVGITGPIVSVHGLFYVGHDAADQALQRHAPQIAARRIVVGESVEHGRVEAALDGGDLLPGISRHGNFLAADRRVRIEKPPRRHGLREVLKPRDVAQFAGEYELRMGRIVAQRVEHPIARGIAGAVEVEPERIGTAHGDDGGGNHRGRAGPGHGRSFGLQELPFANEPIEAIAVVGVVGRVVAVGALMAPICTGAAGVEIVDFNLNFTVEIAHRFVARLRPRWTCRAGNNERLAAFAAFFLLFLLLVARRRTAAGTGRTGG